MNETLQQRRVVIFANGPVSDYASLRAELNSSDTLLCVDGGLRHVDTLGLTPDVIIGDMDSISQLRLLELQNSTAQIQHPSEKDETDLDLALQWAGDNGYDKVLLTGISGGRLDHTLANIHLMALKTWPFDLCGWRPGQYIWLVSSGETLKLNNHAEAILSLLPMTEQVTGVRTEGVKYMLHNEVLEFGTTRGVSNVIESQRASVTINKGRLLIVLTYHNVGFP